MLQDDHSSYFWFHVCADTRVGSSSKTAMYWRVAFGVPEMFTSDGLTHFYELEHAATLKGTGGSRSFYAFVLPME